MQGDALEIDRGHLCLTSTRQRSWPPLSVSKLTVVLELAIVYEFFQTRMEWYVGYLLHIIYVQE